MQEKVQGLDASQWQKKLDWHKAAQQYTFTFIKATGGRYFTDPAFLENWTCARENQFIMGAYHFYYSADPAQQQAEHFIKTVQPHTKAGDLPPALDVEGQSINSSISHEQLLSDIKQWLQTVESAFGKTPVVYSDLDFAKHWLVDDQLATYPLWIAYPDEPIRLPATWDQVGYAFWQFGKKEIDGIKFDYDLFNGTIEELYSGSIKNRPAS